MLQAKLIVVGGEVKTQEVKLKLPTVIGRGKEANLKVPMALVSRQHCEIRERDGRLFIRDLGSLNGTYVNNYKITNEQPLLPGELITVGTVTFRAEYQLLTPASGEAKAAPGGKPASGQVAPAEEPIDFSPLVADRSTARSPGKRPPAVAAMDSTVAGTMSVTVSPGNPVKLSEVPGSQTPKPSAALPPPVRSNRAPAAPPKRDAAPPSLAPSGRGNAGTEQHHALDDFPLETSAQKSISLSALEALQLTSPRQVSFIGDLNFGETAAVPVSDPVKLELGPGDAAAGSSPENPADSRLDSFLRQIAQPSE